jgi:PAS domain S-box-containing protein
VSRIEDSLHRSLAASQALLESAAEGILIVDDLGRIQVVNASTERMFGYARTDLVGKPLEVLVPERFQHAHSQHRAEYFAAPRSRPMGRGLELAARRRDGTEFPVEISLSFVDTDAGRLAMAFITDITERRRVERRLHTEFAVTQIIAEGLALQDATPRMLGAICECLGWELGEVWRVDLEANVLRHGGSWHSPALNCAEFIEFSRQLTFPPGVGVPGCTWASGQPMWVPDVTEEACFLRAAAARRVGLYAACAFPIQSQEGVTAVAVFFGREIQQPDAEVVDLVTDITRRIGLHIEWQRMQDELRRQRQILEQQERLAALGTLAAGLAHEINNPIGIVASRIELMLTESDNPGLPAEIREDLQVLERNVRRVGQIAKGLLSFARQAPRERTPVDLNRVVEETLFLVERQMTRAGIEIRTMLDRTLPPLLGDMGALQQVTLNLFTNAREAMADPGHVTVQTRPAAGRVGWVQLVIADTGPGIPADVLRRVFDPFFTTKAQGTGLGLSLSYGIVQDHGGTIDVETEPGRGTTFILSFPAPAGTPGEPA